MMDARKPLKNQVHDLILAAETGDLPKVKSLYKSGVDINARLLISKQKKILGFYALPVIDTYETALSSAIHANHSEVARYLLSKGAKVEQSYFFDVNYDKYFNKRKRNFFTKNLLGLACFSLVDLSVFKMILQRVKDIDPSVYNSHGNTQESLSFLLSYEAGGVSLCRDNVLDRLILLMCEAVLRYETSLFDNLPFLGACTSIDIQFGLQMKLGKYMADRDFTNTQCAIKSIQYLVSNQLLDMKMGKSLKKEIEKQAVKKREDEDLHPVHAKQRSIKPVKETQKLQKENAVLLKRINKLEKETQELMQQMVELTKQQRPTGHVDKLNGSRGLFSNQVDRFPTQPQNPIPESEKKIILLTRP